MRIRKLTPCCRYSQYTNPIGWPRCSSAARKASVCTSATRQAKTRVGQRAWEGLCKPLCFMDEAMRRSCSAPACGKGQGDPAEATEKATVGRDAFRRGRTLARAKPRRSAPEPTKDPSGG